MFPEKYKYYIKNQNVLLILLLFYVLACNPEDLIGEFGDSIITAKSKVGEVLNTAKSDFAPDAKLAAIYGFNVNAKGQVDLRTPTDNGFVYAVQSDLEQTNEFYVPVYKSYPVKSPVNFTTMLSYIKDAQAKSILGNVFSKLSEINISSTASYDDSPAVLNIMLARSDVSSFRSANPNSKIDMILIPSKSIDSTSVTNTADWIASFYEDTLSLVLWLHPGTVNGTIDILSE